MPRFERPNYMQLNDPEEIYERDRTMAFKVPVVALGIDATVGWCGERKSYWFICIRDSVAHLKGAFDHYLNKPVEVGDLYWADGMWAKAPIECEPDMRTPIPTFSELVNWTWDEFDWPKADRGVLYRLRDAPAYEELIDISTDDHRKRTDNLRDWMAENVFDWGNQLSARRP